jgi:hypothetical protein
MRDIHQNSGKIETEALRQLSTELCRTISLRDREIDLLRRELEIKQKEADTYTKLCNELTNILIKGQQTQDLILLIIPKNVFSCSPEDDTIACYE